MFKTHGVALHLGIGHSRGMLSCLCMATACFNGTTHGHVLLVFLRTILVVHVPVLRPRETARFGLTTYPWVRYHLSLLQVHCHMVAHPCQSNGHSTKQTKFCCFRGPHTGMCHTSVRLCTQLGTIWHLCGFHKKVDKVPTRMTQRPSVSIWASKKPHAHSETQIPDQTVPSAATRLDHWSLQQRAKIDLSWDGMSCRKRLFRGTINSCTVNSAP